MWDVIYKAVNSNLTKPLNTLIDEVKTIATATRTNTATSNTSNDKGTLSQKLAWIISTWTATKAGYIDASTSSRQSEANALTRYNNIMARLNTVKASTSGTGTTLASGSPKCYGSYPDSLRLIYKGIAPVSGLYKITGTFDSSYDYGIFYMFLNEREDFKSYATDTVNQATTGIYTDDSVAKRQQLVNIGTHDGTSATGYFYANMGQPITIWAGGFNDSNNYSKLNSFSITYQKA